MTLVAPGFEAVAREFERGFSERGELGAAFSAVRDGEPVLDLWGGIAARAESRAWNKDSLVPIFSGSKGLVAACMLMLLDRGQLSLDATVCRYWPEFAAGGKASPTVREVVTHTAGLPGIDVPIGVAEMLDDRAMAALLAGQERSRDPRASRTYHLLTYGWLCGELVRRVDGRSIGRFFDEEIAVPLGLELWIGLPAGLEPRVAAVELGAGWGSLAVFDPAAVARDPLMRSVWGNPPAWGPSTFPWNDAAVHAAEIPAVGAIGTARAVAAFYGNLDRLISSGMVRLGRTILERRVDPLTGGEQAFGVGFELQSSRRAFGPVPDAFGHTGAGGSVHGCWPSLGVGFSYAMNLMRDDAGDVRASAVLDALAAALAT